MLIFGLGNPEEKYRQTRHNVGYMVLDSLLKELFSLENSRWESNGSLKSRLAKKDDRILAQPQINMNVNGRAVKAIADFYKIPCQQIIVVHDDLDLPLGQVKVVKDRGAAGHRGVRSVIRQLGTNDFWRVRVGIGRPVSGRPVGYRHEDDQSRQVVDYVLGDFASSQQRKVRRIINKTVKIIKQGIEEGFERVEGKHGI